jgi:CPA2 family monovalent cation:H+ antiporter-2
VPVIVRTQDDQHLDSLRKAGATEVVPEALEGSLMLASHALALLGGPMRRVIRIVQDQRDARYNLLRGFFHGADDNSLDELEQERLASVTLPLGSRAQGRTLESFHLHSLGIKVLSIRRNNGKAISPADDVLLEGGDTLVLSGMAEPLVLAEQKLQKG